LKCFECETRKSSLYKIETLSFKIWLIGIFAWEFSQAFYGLTPSPKRIKGEGEMVMNDKRKGVLVFVGCFTD